LNASFEKQFHNTTTQFFTPQSMTMDMGQILARWRRPVASRVALDLPYWAMRSALYRLIRMAIEMASVVGECFYCWQFYVLQFK
jgi:hypothetical protein